MFESFFVPGRAYSFDYPRHNYRQLPSGTELRRIVVASVRDILYEPLDQTTESLNPLLRRGRWLVTGTDLDKDVERSFYTDSMTNVRALSDDDLLPLKGVEYVVIEQTHVTFKAQRMVEALKYRSSRSSGTICGVLFQAPRELSFETVEDK